MTLYTISGGIDTSFSTKLNQNFTDVDTTAINAYTVGTSVTVSPSSSLTATVSYSVSAPIKDYVLFHIDGVLNANHGASGDATSTLSLYADNTLLQSWAISSSTARPSVYNLISPVYLMLPSATQKTAGMSIKVLVAGTAAATADAFTQLNRIDVITK